MNQYGSIIAGVGLVGLAIFQLSTSDLPGAIQSVLAALAAFGLTAQQHAHNTLQAKLNRRGMI